MFHLVEDKFSVFDDEGLDIPDITAAREIAIEAAREIIAEDIRFGILNLLRRIDVTDEAGHIILSVPFTEVVTVGST